jgi:hypothetical protein
MMRQVAGQSPTPEAAPATAGGMLFDLAHRYPGASVWWSAPTRSWWARHPGLPQPVAAPTLHTLAVALRTALIPRRADGSWALPQVVSS